ncbi:putative membrane protein YabM [Halobacillus andaensis]|uniref:Membrane protein YabM n=1 Tax=Halobacillus andaensis TaxID=1176239 RepID=A0A917BD33_HALAA|nr:polysaccharide biosynthesis protein [Halobacillus andaensis]MBP2006669.1 PST family polysaccharide transporter [Halobacillus andaensis]GGF35683.1 putative membrane protein YabM [Halobacillus andaensis]
MEQTNASHRLIKGALLLTIAGLIGKILSAAYRIPLQNIAGDVGFYIYQQIYPVLGMALMLSLYGFPVAISKLVSELQDQGVKLSLRSFYIPAFAWLSIICGGIFLLGYTQADRLAAVMGDEQLTSSLQAAFFVFLLLPFSSLIRGVFQGKGIMEPTAASQISEQLVRVFVIIGSAIYATRAGNLYQIGIGGAISSILGAAAAAFVLLVFWLRSEKIPVGQESIKPGFFAKTIFFYGVFICLNYMLLLFLQLIDALTLIPGLQTAGFGLEEAKAAKGIFDRGQPLIQLGTVLASSLALALVPSVTKERKEKEPEQVERYIFGGIKYCLFIAAGATAGLVTLFPYVNEVFFQNSKGSSPLQLLMLVILFSSLAITLSSLLQGLGKVVHTAIVVVAALFVKWGMNIGLVPLFEVYGAAAASVITVVFVVGCHVVLLHKEYHFTNWRRLPWFALFGALSGMTGVLFALELGMAGIEHRLALLAYLLFVIALGASVYLYLLIRFGAFEQKELELLPFGEVFVKFLPRGRKV